MYDNRFYTSEIMIKESNYLKHVISCDKALLRIAHLRVYVCAARSCNYLNVLGVVSFIDAQNVKFKLQLMYKRTSDENTPCVKSYRCNMQRIFHTCMYGGLYQYTMFL